MLSLSLLGRKANKRHHSMQQSRKFRSDKSTNNFNHITNSNNQKCKYFENQIQIKIKHIKYLCRSWPLWIQFVTICSFLVIHILWTKSKKEVQCQNSLLNQEYMCKKFTLKMMTEKMIIFFFPILRIKYH